MTNTGDATLGVHDLSDDVLGDLLVGEEFDLEPGASHVFTTTAVVNVDTENTATWTAYLYEGGAGRKPLTALRWMSTLLRSAWSRPSGWVRDVPRPIS